MRVYVIQRLRRCSPGTWSHGLGLRSRVIDTNGSGTRDKSLAHRLSATSTDRFHPSTRGGCSRVLMTTVTAQRYTWQRVKLAKRLTRDGFKFEPNSCFCVRECAPSTSPTMSAEYYTHVAGG